MSRRLVAYFSASGVTAKRAEELASVTEADLYEIAPKVKYTAEDLDWTNKDARSTIESNDPFSRPEMKEKTTDLSAYDTVYVGFPIWWYTVPHIIKTFLDNNFQGLQGKKIEFFATSGGSTIDRALRNLKEEYPELNIIGGKTLNSKVTGDIIG